MVEIGRGHNDHKSVLGKNAAIAQNDIAYVAHARAVDEDLTAGHGLGKASTLTVYFQDLSEAGNENVSVGNAHLKSIAAVGLKVARLSVNGHKVEGLGQCHHQLQLLLAGVTRNVDAADGGIVDHTDSALAELVDNTSHKLFVAGNGAGRDDHDIVAVESDLGVISEGHTVESRHRLTLAAGADQHKLLGAVTLDIVDIDKHALGQIDISELHGRGDDRDHTAAGNSHLPVMPRRDVKYLLNAVNVGREGGNNYALFLIGVENVLERSTDGALRGSVAGSLGVGRLAHQKQNALIAKLAEAGNVHNIALNWCQVQLEVTRVDEHAERCADGQTAGVGNRVVDTDELNAEAAEAHGIVGLHAMEIGVPGQAMLLELVLNDLESQPSAVNGRIYGAQNVRNGADVVLVTVGQHHTADLVPVLFEISDIGNDEIDTEHILVGESDAAVDDNNIVTVLNGGNILSDLTDAAEGYDAQLCAAAVLALQLRDLLGLAAGYGAVGRQSLRLFLLPLGLGFLFRRSVRRGVVSCGSVVPSLFICGGLFLTGRLRDLGNLIILTASSLLLGGL